MPTSAPNTSGLTERERRIDHATLQIALHPLTFGSHFGRAKHGAIWVSLTGLDLIRREFRRPSSAQDRLDYMTGIKLSSTA